ncbi:hypothetical protein ES288_A05G193300v1 [Gossypium darwinii]|uniref:Ubiquitin-like domain-containing protein n=1 Tax=Gossypium darwinii TaxID=34276 RepID=A0A5D2GJK3_GOSDA|nr:hypothetical protein ES288_A05G193300v1 [Gossypium darwinii]
MADQHSNEGLITGSVSGESSNALIELRVKTLDSQICSLHVEKNTSVSLFKERISNAIGVPVGQQRLIFRGKVLKGDHLLSEYHVENGDTLHLVERQPTQSQPLSETSSGDTNGNNSNQGNDASAGIPHNRVGQILHSVVLGTFNVGDQGEGIIPDLTRVIGAVLNSFGVGSQPSATSTTRQSSTSAPQGISTDGVRGGRPGGENQAGIQTQSPQSFPAATQFIPVPLTAAPISIPSLNSPIPDSLNTLSEFMNHMEAHSPNGYQPHTSVTNRREQPRVALPSDARGLPTPEALSIVMRHAEQLLSSHAIAALSHIAGRLEQERNSTDPALRGQIQTESVQVGLTMQHLGALLLELGRTILMLRMGQFPAESSVNAGPAVYISPSGPNPIMVQPFPLQTSSLLSSSNSSLNSLNISPAGIGNTLRNINIHIHAGTALAPMVSAVGNRTGNGVGVQWEHGNNAGPDPMRVLPVRNVIAAARPAHSTGAVSGATQSAPTDSSLSSALAEVTSRIRDLVSNMQGQNQGASGDDAGTGQPDNMAASGAGDSSVALLADLHATEERSQPQLDEHSNNTTESGKSSKDVSTGTVGCPPSSSGEFLVKSEDPSASVQKSTEENAKPVPLGLGLGGLGRKRRVKQAKSSLSTRDTGTTSYSLDESLSARTTGQKILQSLASQSSSMNRVEDDSLSSNPAIQSNRSSGLQSSDDQLDVANAVSEVLQSPAINGLLAGVSEQTGVGSPDVFRNMLWQLTQSPQIMNTVNQIAQQVDSQDIGNMFSGLGGGQDGGVDLSRMVQQMMPIVSQALGQGASAPPPFHAVEPKQQVHHDGRKSNAADKPCDSDFQDNIQQTAQRIEQLNSPFDVFHAVAEIAFQVYGIDNGRNTEEFLSELCGDESLAEEYIEMLRQDIRRRFQDKCEEDKC